MSGRRSPCLQPHDDAARHFFVGAGRIKAVAAWQVDQFRRVAVGKAKMAGFALDGNAGIIGNFLPRAGQRVEQGAFAGIGVAREDNEGSELPSSVQAGIVTATGLDRYRLARAICVPLSSSVLLSGRSDHSSRTYPCKAFQPTRLCQYRARANAGPRLSEMAPSQSPRLWQLCLMRQQVKGCGWQHICRNSIFLIAIDYQY